MKKLYLNLIKILISIIILAVIFKFIDFNTLILALKQSKKIFLIPILLLLILFLIIRSYIFQKLLHKKISFKEAFSLSLIAIALNVFLPASSGGLFRSYFGYKRTGLKEEMLSVSIIDLLIAGISIFALGIIFSWIFSFYYTIIFLILFVILSIFIFAPKLVPWNLMTKLIKIFSKAELSKEKLISSFSLSLPLKLNIFFLSLISWIVSFLEFYLICKMFSINIDLFYIFTISPLITLARIFPFTFTGLGSKDAVVVYFFSLININPTLSLLASLTHFIINILPGLFAIPLFFKKEFTSEKIKLASDLDKEKWDDFILKNKGTIFQLFKWKNIIEKTTSYKPYYFYLEENNEIMAVLPAFLIKNIFFGNKLISVPYGDEAGPLGDATSVNIILDELIKNNLNLDQIEIHRLDLENKNFIKSWNYYTFLINLNKSEQEILIGFDKKLRNIIKKTEKENLTIEEIASLKQLKIFYSIYQKNMHELGTPPLSFKFFKNLFIELYPNNLKAYLIKYNHIYIAGSIFLIDNETARWLHGVSHPKFKDLNSITLMIWNFIKTHNTKLETLDLGSTRENSGNFDFKKKFSNNLKDRNWKYLFFNKKIIIDPRTEELKTYIKVWKHIPTPICNLIGPLIRKYTGR